MHHVFLPMLVVTTSLHARGAHVTATVLHLASFDLHGLERRGAPKEFDRACDWFGVSFVFDSQLKIANNNIKQ